MSEWIDSLDSNLISVILPTYNRPQFLRASLHHIYSSQLSNCELEIIIVDDGSTEDNLSVIFDYDKLLNIYYIKLDQNSQTVCVPRNIGISWANGRIIAPTDDDCFVLPNKFNNLFNKLNEDLANIMAFGNREVYHIDNNGDFNLSSVVDCAHFQNLPYKRDVGLDNGQFIYRTDVYNSIDPIFSINACDWYTYSSFHHLGNFAHINESVCQYLWHGKNISLNGASCRKNPLTVLPNYLSYFREGPYLDKCRSILNP